MSNSEQQSLFHCFCREIAKHTKISESMIKHIVKTKLGNVKTASFKMSGMVFYESEPMSVTKYKPFDQNLTEHDHAHNLISMNALIESIQAWASTDLGLQLASINEVKV
tara:strand:+ start:641 stop:967 length:327 start_codon:yes stop_codon:yes gene_type:complete